MTTIQNQDLPENETISIICPSRLRPIQLASMISSCLDTAINPKLIEFCIYIDNDDDSYEKFQDSFPEIRIKFLRGPRMWLSSMFNSLLTQVSGDYILWLGDDVKFQTKNWDLIMRSEIKKFPKYLGVVHVNDQAKSYEQIYATIGMVHRNWIETFGFLFTPHMRDNGIDFWITNVANQVNRRTYREDVVVEHMQFRQGKSEIDSTYLDRTYDQKLYNPQSLYRKLKDERRRDSLLLSERIGQSKVEFDSRYLLSSIYLKFTKPSFVLSNINATRVYVGSLSNFNFCRSAFLKLSKRNFKQKWD